MIIDSFDNILKYSENCAKLQKAADFLASVDIDKFTPGQKIGIDGDSMYAVFLEYETKAPNCAKWEYHEKFTDLHCIISGGERINSTARDMLTGVDAYDFEGDSVTAADSDGAAIDIDIDAGFFALFEPGEPHRPGGVNPQCPERVCKFVIKIAADKAAQGENDE